MKKLLTQVRSSRAKGRRQLFGATAALVAGMFGLASPVALAADEPWPSKPVRVVVPWPAGGATDVLARILAERLTAKLGQTFVVENRPGATGTIGSQWVLQQPPDGHTLLVMVSSLHSFAPAVSKSLPFDTVSAFYPISLFVTFPSVMVVPANSPYNSLNDVIAAAKQSPGKITFASGGNGSAPHLIPELLAMSTGTQFLHVPYKGAGLAIPDLIGGQTAFMIDSLPSPLPHIRSGRLKALALTSNKRSPLLPLVPTVSETIPGFQAVLWIGIGAQPLLPAPVAAKIADAIRQVSAEPAYVERLRAMGSEAGASASTEEFKNFMLAQRQQWMRIVTDAKIPLNE